MAEVDKAKAKEIVLKGIKDKEIDAIVYTTKVNPIIDKKTGKENQQEHDKLENALKVFIAGSVPVIDAHMHIQSVNTAPLTLIWTLLYQKTLGLDHPWWKDITELHSKGQNRNTTYSPITDENADLRKYGFFDMGVITRLSTDLIAKLFMGTIKNSEMKETLYWTLGIVGSTSTESAGKEAKLEDLSGERTKLYADEFYNKEAKYFNNTKILHLFGVMPMDMSYAHYWGQFGLPIYLPILKDKTNDAVDGYYYINDFIQATITQVQKSTHNVMIDPTNYIPETRITGAETLVHLYPDSDIFINQIKSFLKYYRYKAEIIDEQPEPFLIFFEDKILNSIEEKIKNKPHKPEEPVYDQSRYDKEYIDEYNKKFEKYKSERKDFDNYKKDIENELDKVYNNYSKNIIKTYNHFIIPAPAENPERFEDYWVQRDCTEASAVRFPMQLIPFYHYDPRRHVADNDTSRQTKKDNLAKQHAFFQSLIVWKSFSTREFTISGDFINLKPFGVINSNYFDLLLKNYNEEELDKKIENLEKKYEEQVQKKVPEEICVNEGLDKKLESEVSQAYISTLTGYRCPDSKVFENTIAKEGLFWGMKMYPTLGYRPDDFQTYAHLKNFYSECIKNHLPIMIHGSPWGMVIGDSHNYMRETKKQEIYNIYDTIDYVDENCAHPKNWRGVLSTEGLSELKICLAHFGGETIWKNKKTEIKRKIINNGKVEIKTESILPPDWRQDVINLINDYNNVYTDLACFLNDDTDKIANQLADYLNNDNKEKLKKRILMGSDWYLYEPNKDYKGIAKYYYQMFEVLKKVSKKVNWDVWNQFAVINPLRFLGLLDANNDPSDSAKITMDNLTKYASNMKKKINRRKWMRRMELSPDDRINALSRIKEEKDCKTDDDKTDSIVVQLSNMNIISSKELKNGKSKKLKILDM
jgi:hypothetical protein